MFKARWVSTGSTQRHLLFRKFKDSVRTLTSTSRTRISLHGTALSCNTPKLCQLGPLQRRSYQRLPIQKISTITRVCLWQTNLIRMYRQEFEILVVIFEWRNLPTQLQTKFLQRKGSVKGVFASCNGELQTNLSKIGLKIHHLGGVWFHTIK